MAVTFYQSHCFVLCACLNDHHIERFRPELQMSYISPNNIYFFHKFRICENRGLIFMSNYLLCRKITNRRKCCTTNFSVSKVNAKFIRNLFRTLEFNTCRQIQTLCYVFVSCTSKNCVTLLCDLEMQHIVACHYNTDIEPFPLPSHITLYRT